MRIKDLCEDDRPREKMLQKGAGVLSNAELLAILLRTGTGRMNVIDVARVLLQAGGGKLNEIGTMSVEALCRTEGIGPGKAVTLAAAFELGKRCAIESTTGVRTSISSPKDVFRLMWPLLKGLDHEECWALYLNRANYLISKERISSGGMDSTTLDCRYILKKALEKQASGLIVVHNHPSGSAMPGTADMQATRLLNKALKACELSLIDHVVIAEDSYYSFADEKLEKS